MKNTVLVTGGTEGIGRAVAAALAQRGSRVVLVGRNEENGREALASLAGEDHVFLRADLSLLSETARVVREVQRITDRLDALVCCAGILSTIPEWTREDLERTFVLNYLSRYLMIRLLEPFLARAASPRVVLVANAGMYKDTIDLDDLQYRRGKPGIDLSARSQFANDLLATGLAARLSGVEVTCVYPGMVRTRVFENARGLPWLFRLIVPLLRLFQIAPAVAAETPVFLATSALARGTSGRFFGPRCTERRVPERAQNGARRTALLAASEELVTPWLPAPAPARVVEHA